MQEELMDLDKEAVAKIVEYASELAGDKEKISTHFNSINEVVGEAAMWAKLDKSKVVTKEYVQKALDERIDRIKKYDTKYLQMVKEDILGDKTILANISAGSLFAETFFGRSYDHSVVSFFAMENCEILMLPFKKFFDTLDGSLAIKKLLSNFVSIMADNNIRLVEKTEILCKKSLRSKILAYLEYETRYLEEKKITIPFNRTDLANYLDADRSALTRELSRMREDGLIDFEKNTFVLLGQ
jgi:CRP-like cAMP-binding protein